MRKKSSNSAEVRFFKLDYEKVLEELREYARKAVDRGARTVILIGSLARGDYTAFSDADVVIVSDNVPERFLDRITDFIDPTLSVDVEPRVYTSRELLKMAEEGKKLVREILEYGKLLAGDESIIEAVREALEHKPLERG
ncbi:MAG: DNA polymerase III subunit beta [Candidatus Bathyarchaeota archaeon B24]|nr:MAG: DNA polymerase III subunit beta [Candidatus Bathyarchaeota archaeon B24]RLI26389.1 MAG: nucleotidyltransferase domain-containing protein [Candidatus Bathyarchaeota archaeon]